MLMEGTTVWSHQTASRWIAAIWFWKDRSTSRSGGDKQGHCAPARQLQATHMPLGQFKARHGVGGLGATRHAAQPLSAPPADD